MGPSTRQLMHLNFFSSFQFSISAARFDVCTHAAPHRSEIESSSDSQRMKKLQKPSETEEVGGGAEVMDRAADIRICGESKFRELEDEFLQKQARIWLSEVLKRRWDEDQNISDMLADGDVLFDTSNVLWKMFIEKGVEVKDLRIFGRTTKCKKHSSKYMPYSNVDAFLKICKLMGLTGVDLFSPSDVVERRDTRKVCMCIRSLSKKARSMHINVPDFDMVTCTITMPTNLIGCIRRSLELSQCGAVSSESSHSCNYSDPLSMKAKFVASLASSYDLYSEESDDANSSVSVGYYRPSSKMHFDTALLKKSDSLSSIESFSLSKSNNLEEALAHLGVCNHDMDKHDFLSSPSVNSSECVVDISTLSCFNVKPIDTDSHRSSTTQNPHSGASTVPSDGLHDPCVCSSEIFLDKRRIRKTSTKNSSPASDLEGRGYPFYCSEEESKCMDMLSEGPISSQMCDQGDFIYNLATQGTSCNQHTNVLNFDFDDIHIEDDQDPFESQLGNVVDQMANLVNKCGKGHNDSCDEMVVYSHRLEPDMKNEENDISVSCLDFQSYSSDVYLSSQVASDYGEDEPELLYKIKNWSVDYEDLENVHLSIIERFLSTTSCSKSEPSICSEKWDESDCWNLDVDGNDVDLKPVLPIGSCEQFQHFFDESSCEDKPVEDLRFMGAVEEKRVIGFPNDAHQANIVEGTRETAHGTDSPCEQEACDDVLLHCCTNDKEFDAAKSTFSHTPVENFDANQDEEECLEAKLIEAEVLVLKDHETAKLDQSKKRKSSILKSIMGGAALLGVLAFFLNTRTPKEDSTKKPDSEPSPFSGEEKKFTSNKANDGVMKKGVYAAGKFKFS